MAPPPLTRLPRGRGRLALIAAAALCFLLASAGAARAHATYVKSSPEADARLARPPTEVRISFSEPVVPRFSEIQVLDPSGRRVDDRALAALSDTTLRTGLTSIGGGGYTVAWKVLSAIDGHETRGSFVFAVGDAPLPAVPDIAAFPPPAPLDVAGRALTFGGLALLIGPAVFALSVARRDDERRGVTGLVPPGAIALVAGSVLMLEQGGGLALAESRLGQALLARGALGALALLAPFMKASRTPWVVLALGALAASATSLQSHAAALGDALQVALDLAHLLAAATWAGALVALAVVALPGHRDDPRSARDLGGLVGRFSALGVVAVSALALTGAAQSFLRLVTPLDLVETDYGLAILAKVALFAPALALAALNLLRHGPALRAARDGPRIRRRLELGVLAEIVLLGAVLVATALLTALVPPSTPTGAAYGGVEHAAGLRVQLLARSAQPGQNRFVVRLREGLGRAAADVEKVSLRFTMIEHDMGVQELVARERAPGEYAVDASPTSMFGTWRIEVIVRRVARDEARAVFLMPVSVSAEAGAVARVVQAGTLTLVVFTDPGVPVAGQPVTLDIVAIDPKGDPVTDAAVVVALEGAQRAARNEGNGRYRLELPAQTAGEKPTLITVSGPGGGQARYSFTVAP